MILGRLLTKVLAVKFITSSRSGSEYRGHRGHWDGSPGVRWGRRAQRSLRGGDSKGRERDTPGFFEGVKTVIS